MNTARGAMSSAVTDSAPARAAVTARIPVPVQKSRTFAPGGGPAERTNTLATLGVRYAFKEADLSAGVATMISGLPLLIPLVVLLLRRLNRSMEGRDA